MKKALFSDILENNSLRCTICQRRCIIGNGQYGFCHTRINKEGTIYSLAYGQVSTLTFAPIEKKPLFHFYPGSIWLSLGTLGCNFLCPGCQNWEIAHKKFHSDRNSITQYLPPKEAINIAKKRKSMGLSFTYNEPSVWFEYTLDCARLAKKEGLFTNYVTNGFITSEALDEIGPWLDAYRVDIKGFTAGLYKKIAGISSFDEILENTVRAKKKWEMHIEIVTNIIPTYNDDDCQLNAIASWIASELGKNTPWHVTRFVPHLKLSTLMQTPVETLERARTIGIDQGLRYVYIGNLFRHPAENTYCPECNMLLIERDSFSVGNNLIKNGQCPNCETIIPGRWK
ncbi:MAG: AmmeMemoRadiSam system radical SAM enzyme [Spirochaetota bacterium]|nr:MAG: AmmeMemoRadiSam system radical SAM enzyme [Spirochaetota bacterium]